ncbi:MAG: S8 family serine peptidase [Candidatus Latescibacteria bacterium]|nr:S8 family serine peptidase [Candidatus Latescibacterota bacterium]NIM22560.1 S8 family serine peptidase [Candidatus Latescibacterota bacterium]NIM64849.1 S8 family serine peptidase [Candidatus Latescibacterota bacterium]NIO01364.1 S8 family serine peptidase [Candidatus Latescibacterota bacterium]NIO27874.1 S8 family serine peptidase [Candidatus Latescibacterota bacterium]
MLQKKKISSSVAVLLAVLLLIPVVYSADTSIDIKDKISPGLAAKLTAAQPGEVVTAIVKMRAVANTNRIRGMRAAVFTELRRTSRESQADLVSYLDSPGTRSRVQKIRQFWIDNIVLVKATRDVIESIAARPDVLTVFENFIITLPPRPEDSAEGKWGGPNRAAQQQTQPWDSITRIGAKQVWTTFGLDGTGVVVGGLDTGVDISHPDINGKMVTNNPLDPTYPGGWAEFDSNGDIIPGSVPHDSDDHGTHTTGTMIGGNASGYDIGVAPGANLMHGLVIPGGSGTFAQVAGGMEWIIDPDENPATDDGAQLVNMSLGATGTYPEMIAPTDNMVAANVFPSFAIGNSGPSPSTTASPGNVPSAYGVGATDSSEVIASFSGRGPVTWNSPPYVGTWIKPDISAPGVAIYSSVPGGGWEWNGWNGTSMATPHVSGTIALMLQGNPMLTVDQTKLLLSQTAIDYGDPGMDNSYGWGRVSAFGAVSAALVGVGTLEGTVYSSGGGTVDNAKVLIVDTGQKVYTDAFGHYTVQLVAGDHTVEVSRFGYETATEVVSVAADVVTVQDFTLNQLPSGTVAGYVTDAETAAGIAADIIVKLAGEPVVWSSTNPATGEYSIGLPVGTYDLIFSPVFPYPITTRTDIVIMEGMTTTLNVPMEGAQILIVDDDGGDAYQMYYEQAVLAAGRSYLTVTAPPTAAEMALFESVVWLTGDDYTTTLTAVDQAEIAAYLDSGGRLFISGQDIGYDIRTADFYANYLHATYVQDDVKLGAVIGEATHPVGTGLAFDIKGGDGANNQSYASEIDPIAPALTAFVYDPLVPEATAGAEVVLVKEQVSSNGINSSGTAGLSYDDGTYKLVYFAFGFEAIATAGDRSTVMARILDWLQGYPEIDHTPLGDTENTTDPYQVLAVITSDYFALDPSSFAVVYDVGGPEASIPMTPTGNPDEYEAFIPAQPLDTQVNYYITASDIEGHTSTDPMGAPMNKHSFWVAPDDEAPVVEHRRYYNTNDLDGPYRIYADCTDNIGVESVYLMFSKNGGMYHRVKMTQQSDQYYGEIPGPSEVGDYYDYYLYAMDESYSGNVTRVPETGTYHFEIVKVFVWDFEMDDGGFTQAGDVWEWGEPTTGPGSAHSGVNLWATVLDGNYPRLADATLDIPPITLAASKPYAILSFWHWYYIETNYDGGNVKVSTDGGTNWDVVEPLGGYDGIARTGNEGIPGEPCFTGYNNDFWQEELFDLSAYSGQQVIIRYHFGSDGSIQRSGWYVDDVMLRSTDVDNIPPVISDTEVPASSFDTIGPYEVSTYVVDALSGVGTVSVFYSTNDGASYTELPMSPGGDPNQWVADIPGQASGTTIKLYIKATDTASTPNETTDPPGAPADTYEFAILPSAPILVLQMASPATSLEMFRDALEANGHAADYWYRPTQGWLSADKLGLYRTVIVDETSYLTTTERNDLAAYLESGALGAKKQIFILGRDLGYYSSTRPWIEQYMRAAYVQDNPGWTQLSGEPGEPIGAGETFVISGSYPDEVQRSATYPGGEIIYRYTGEGTSLISREELEETYEKDFKEWDGVMPHAPKSTDATAAMKYNADTYRSVYFCFNFYYIQEPARRAGIMDRVLGWLSMPDIVHTPLLDTEDTLSAYPVVALVYSETLDPTRVKLTYDVGAGPVTVQMLPTGNPDEYGASIPPQSFGTTVRYYIRAANVDGSTAYDPPGAPDEQHTFEVTADTEPPVIVHSPYPNSADQTGPYGIQATITDNVGVDPSGVSVTYNKNGGTNVTIPMASLGGDLYQADIPGPSVLGDVYNYYIRARDIADVPNTAREPAVGYHSFEIVDYYAWDFEADDGGFTATGPDWEWGEPTEGPDSAHSGIKLWATKVGGNYSSSSNSKLDLPPVIVPSGATYAALSFWQWYYIENYFDGGNVKISTDGGSSWTILTPDIGYPEDAASSSNAGIPGEPCFSGYNNDVWHKATFDLTPYKGTAVLIRLHFGSDASVQRVGWYVDDVRIEGMEDTVPPEFVSTDVPASTFDTVGPYTVTTTVQDALSGVAMVTLYYSTDDGSSWTSVAMSPTGSPDEYSGDIPGQSSGTRIKLYAEATDNAANTSTDPAGAPATTYEFGIMPSGDYLVLLGGASHTTPEMFQAAFSAIGRTADIWDWDNLGVPTVAILQAYDAVIVDESWYFDTTQRDTLGAFLSTARPNLNQIFMLGRDLSYGSSARPWMEQYTGAAYERDDPGWRQLTSTPGDPIGAGETFTIQGYYPDELKLSTTYPGGAVIYKYSGMGSSLDLFDTEQELREFYEKEGKPWDPKLWPMAPTGPDSAAGVRYVNTTHASVYFSFNLKYIQEESRRAAVLDRVLNWLDTAMSSEGVELAAENMTPEIPDRLTLWQNYPNPFNPVTTIKVGIPNDLKGSVSLKIYNVTGQLVKTVFVGRKPAGVYTFQWDGTNNVGQTVSTGIYFARFAAGDMKLTRKMILLK